MISFNNYYIVLITFFAKLIDCGFISELVDVRGNNAIKEVRILYLDEKSPYPLVRGKPMFAEIDFIPRYIPQLTYWLAVSVILPKQIRSGRGGPWVLGWHQEVFTLPKCRLCTNLNQTYTMPVTLYLPDDGWCPTGLVPTGWKVEALPKNPGESDNTDMIIGVAIDERAQIQLINSDKSIHCKNRHEIINYTIPIYF